jgi:hypothetical protein
MSTTMGIPFIVEGVTFGSVRDALCAIYWLYDGMTQEEWTDCHKYVIPMQHNFENPIQAGSEDTYIEYWIDEDDRITQDSSRQGVFIDDNENKTFEKFNVARKLARVTVRFMGKYGESWAKAFHHLTKRGSVATIFRDYCNATALEYIGKIVPINVDYFKVGNTTVAYDMTIDLDYLEVIGLPAERLLYISLGSGVISTQ